VQADATLAKNIAAAINTQYRLSNFTGLIFVPELYLVQEADECVPSNPRDAKLYYPVTDRDTGVMDPVKERVYTKGEAVF
jgi:hypothetical protein